MEEKYIEAYYRMQALKDFVTANGKYISTKDIFAILGIVVDEKE